ncbi:MAG: SEC-C domain-containing protein [Myxococcales bacterium]|nr:SEC-C domain-containing protein [Myxococcales bacterium]
MLLDPFRRRYGKAYATRAPPESGPARGAPCPCGGGKKYKRCCGPAKG